MNTSSLLKKYLAHSHVIHYVISALGFAYLTGICTFIKIPLFWTPVPITGQSLVVLLSGIILGKKWGPVSQAIYVLLGIAGVPWFMGGSTHSLFYPTGGYLIGFILASFVVGYCTDPSPFVKISSFAKATEDATGDTVETKRSYWQLFGLLVFAHIFIIHACGLIQLHIWLSCTTKTSPSFSNLLFSGCLPFIPGDVLKIALVAKISRRLMPFRAKQM